MPGPRMQSLNGYAPSQHRVFGQIHDTHAALAELFENSIMRNCLADHARTLFLRLREKEENLAARMTEGIVR